MGFFDFLKHKELAEIELLKKSLLLAKEKEERLSSEINVLQSKCSQLSKYEAIDEAEKEKNRILSIIMEHNEKFEREKHHNLDEINSLKSQINTLSEEIKQKESQIVELDETILLQEFGMYSPVYNFANSELYKDKLEEIRAKQKDMIISKTAATCSVSWTVNGSITQGHVMTNQNIKQIIRCFNNECDILINKVKFNNINAFIEKIRKSYNILNRMNTKNKVSISIEYMELKLQELKLAYEYAVKKQEEKEEQRRIRELIREEERLQKEIEESRRNIEKESKHYTNALIRLKSQIDECCDIFEKAMLLERKTEIEKHLTNLNLAMKNLDYREANKRAGYVYIISNIGSFGENIYKIGMTRRLDPMDRVHELGDASVPFKFDVHAIIFSDDAPTLETALHHAFENKRVNMINNRREFFKVSIEEIEEVVKENYDKTVEFTKMPQAEQYRESQKIIQQLNSLDAG